MAAKLQTSPVMNLAARSEDSLGQGDDRGVIHESLTVAQGGGDVDTTGVSRSLQRGHESHRSEVPGFETVRELREDPREGSYKAAGDGSRGTSPLKSRLSRKGKELMDWVRSKSGGSPPAPSNPRQDTHSLRSDTTQQAVGTEEMLVEDTSAAYFSAEPAGRGGEGAGGRQLVHPNGDELFGLTSNVTRLEPHEVQARMRELESHYKDEFQGRGTRSTEALHPVVELREDPGQFELDDERTVSGAPRAALSEEENFGNLNSNVGSIAEELMDSLELTGYQAAAVERLMMEKIQEVLDVRVQELKADMNKALQGQEVLHQLALEELCDDLKEARWKVQQEKNAADQVVILAHDKADQKVKEAIDHWKAKLAEVSVDSETVRDALEAANLQLDSWATIAKRDAAATVADAIAP